MKIYLISYGDEQYANRRSMFKNMALSSSFFDDVQVFSPEDIDEKFNDRIYKYVKTARGGGFWIWKPYFVKRVFARLAANDLLIYCDVGCTINLLAKRRFNEYIELVSSSKTGTLDFCLEHKEYRFTKQEVFSHFNTTSDIIESAQLVGGILILRKSDEADLRVNLWYETAVNYPLLFTDVIGVQQRPDFFDHRHDQSIFSVIRKKFGATQIPDETYFSDFFNQGIDYPFWATRLKG